MFYLMYCVREKPEKKNILIMKHIVLGREEKEVGLRLLGKQVRKTFEVCSFGAVNSLKTCVMSECEASLEFVLLFFFPLV